LPYDKCPQALVAFSGTPRDLFWEAIVRGIRKEVVDQFASIEIEARSYGLGTALQSVDQCAGALVSFVHAVRRSAVKKDALLRRGVERTSLEADHGHWEDVSDQAIYRQAEAIKAGLQELLGGTPTVGPTAEKPRLTSIEIERRKMLFALIIAHNFTSSFQDLEAVNDVYNIGMASSLLPSSISPWVGLGWVQKNANLDGQVSALLVRDHYGDALQLIMEWLGATSLTVNVRKQEIISDIAPTGDVSLPDGWTWFSLTDDGSGDLAPGSDRMVPLNHNDPELASISESLSSAIEHVRGDNGLDRREEILHSLGVVRGLLDRAELSMLHLRVGIPMLMEDAVALAAGWGKVAVIEAVKAAVVDWVRRTFGF